MRVGETSTLTVAEASGLPRDADLRRPIVLIWPRASKLTACGSCRDQLRANDYVARMRLFAEAAEEFHRREFGHAYTPYLGSSA